MKKENIKPQKVSSKNHYNNLEFRKIMKLQTIDPEYAAEKFKEYLDKYPTDYYAAYMYVSLLITIQEFYEAEILLDKLDAFIKETFEENNNKRRLLESGISSSCRIKLLLYTKRYLKLYEYMKDTGKDKDTTISATYLYARKKIGLPINKDDLSGTYLSKQIYQYSEDELIKCIEKHFSFENGTEKNEAVFASDIEIKQLLREIRNNLNIENRYCSGMLEDTYYFKLDYCGKNESGSCDYFTVKCFTDTNEIITLYPTKNGSEFKHEDLNYIRKKQDIKQKQLSRIDKFNQRYNKYKKEL